MSEPPKSVEEIAKAAAEAAGLKPGFDDIKRCRLSDTEKKLARDGVSKLPDRTYTGRRSTKTVGVSSGKARVTVKTAKELFDSNAIHPDKRENAICEVAANEAEMPILHSPAGQAIIEDGNHSILAADDLGYDDIEVSYPLAHEERLKQQLGDDFRPCRSA